MDEDSTRQARIPTLHVVADSIPLAYFRAMKAVWEHGISMRTEYDRRNRNGDFIDPPSREARVLVEVTDPFAQPRFPPVSFCEIGAYIAEVMGLKDHYVVPIDELKRCRDGELAATRWPYTYHQRLFAHPAEDGSVVDQIELAVERMVATPHSRRAVASTSVPNLDSFLKEDIPCLREVQLRCPLDGKGDRVLNMNTVWRSRDLYKAWADNVIGMTFLMGKIARDLEERSGERVRVGSYADYSFSLHIYGQDFSAVGGDAERGLRSFFDNFDEQKILQRSMTGERARDLLILPQLQELRTEAKIKEWKLDDRAVALLDTLINDLSSGRVFP